MLNGNKSYLISFTALFSKKGYELALGVDTIFDGIRDTKYHLTAPAYSTYHSLKLDVMKNANKLPYTSTSLFGDGLKGAAIATDVEGVELETVFSQVASYLSDIQRSLSGENRLLAENTTAKPIFASTSKQATSILPYSLAVNHGLHVGGYVIDAAEDTLMAAESVAGGSASNVDSIFKAGDTVGLGIDAAEWIKSRNLTNEEYKTCVGIDPSASKRYQPILDAIEDRQEIFHTRLGNGFIIDFTNSEVPSLRKDADVIASLFSMKSEAQYGLVVDAFSHVGNRCFDTLAVIDAFQSANERIPAKEVDMPVYFTSGVHHDAGHFAYVIDGGSAWSGSGNDAALELVSAGTSYRTNEMISEGDSLTDVIYRTDGDAPASIVSSSNEVEVFTVREENSKAQSFKRIIANAPEVLSAGRLFEIMYGNKAAATIQAGLERLVDSLVDGDLAIADSGSVTDAVVSQIREAMSGMGSVEGIKVPTEVGYVEYFGNAAEANMEHGKVEYFGEAEESKPEHGLSQAFGEGIYQEAEIAERNVDREVEAAHDMNKAIVEANQRLELQLIEESSALEHMDALLEHTALGISANTHDIDLSDPVHVRSTIVPESDGSINIEAASYIQDYDVLTTPVEKGKHLRDFDVVLQNTERADVVESSEGILGANEKGQGGIRVYDAVNSRPEKGSTDNIFIKMTMNNYENAIVDGIGSESVICSEEVAESYGTSVGRAPHEGELGDNITIGEGKLDREIAQGSADNVHDADIQDLGGLTGDNVFIADNHESEPAYIGDRNVIVDNQELLEGQVDGGTVETFITEGSAADSIPVTEPAHIEEVSNGIRKKKRIPTDIQSSGDALRKKRIYESAIENPDEGERIRAIVNTDITSEQDANKVRRVIETVIEKPEGGTMITPPDSKKPRIWLILGKIASWNIWNWKKTR